jgi:hypothetical protein
LKAGIPYSASLTGMYHTLPWLLGICFWWAADVFQILELYRQRSDTENVFEELKNQ